MWSILSRVDKHLWQQSLELSEQPGPLGANYNTHTQSVTQHFEKIPDFQWMLSVCFHLLGPLWVVGHSLVDQVTGDLYDMNTLLVHLWTKIQLVRDDVCGGWDQSRITCFTQWNNQPKDSGLKTRYHSCEQQGHEQCAGYQQEDNENTNQLIQGALQPHDHLQRDQREREREISFNKTILIYHATVWEHRNLLPLCQTWGTIVFLWFWKPKSKMLTSFSKIKQLKEQFTQQSKILFLFTFSSMVKQKEKW